MSTYLDDYYGAQIRTVSFKTLYDRVVREVGLIPETWNPSAYQKDQLCDFISDRLQKAYEADWWTALSPIIEKAVSGDATTGYYVPKAVIPSGAGAPASGVSLVHMDAIRWITTLNPAVARRPKALPYRLSDRGIELPTDAPATVWIQFRLAPPRVTITTTYSGAASYGRDALVYDGSAHCYRSLQDSNSGNALSLKVYWEKQHIPALFLRYVARGVRADWLRLQGDSQQAADAESGRAQAELERLQGNDRDAQRQQESAHVVLT